MINILIIIVMGLAIAGAAAFAALTFISTAQQSTDAYLNLIRLEETAAAIQSNLLHISNVVRAPNGTNGSDYMQVPTWITHNAQTVGGIPFHYCPFSTSAVAGTAGTVDYPGAGNYAIQTTSSADTGNHAYVMTGTKPAAAPAATVGLLIMPAPNSTSMPSCSNITVSGGAYYIAGGVVIPILTSPPIATRYVPAAPSYVNVYVSQAGSGAATGRDSSNPMSLTNALLMWDDLKPRVMVLNLAAGTYTILTTTFPSASSSEAGNPLGRKLYFKGGSGAMATTILSSSSTSVNYDIAADLHFENVTFNNNNSPTLTVNMNQKVTMNNVAGHFGTIAVYGDWNIYGPTALTFSVGLNVYTGGQVNVLDTLSMTVSTSGGINMHIRGGAINVNGGSFTFNGLMTASNQIIIYPGGVIRVNNGTFTFNNDGAATTRKIVFYVGSRMEVVNGSTVTVNHTPGTAEAFYLWGGSLYVDASYLRFPSGAAIGVRLMDGAEFFMTNGSEIGDATNKPATGVYDTTSGAIRIGGDTGLGAQSKVYATTLCWSGQSAPTMFSRSNEGNGQNSAPSVAGSYDYLQIDNNTDWLCVR